MAASNHFIPVEITYKNMRFLMGQNPSHAFFDRFIEELKKNGVTTLVRVCEATYNSAMLEREGIQVLDWLFDDGAAPPSQIVEQWLHLVKMNFHENPESCIAVHCGTGLGRAPVLVAIALMEKGMKCEKAVQFIRQKRRGAFNSKQLLYLENYQPKKCVRFRNSCFFP
ncbi:protein tyrosine phosphatase type IVA 1-like [Echinops telfairi]|uniref:Protein tyrosine phosphatase type IVA 1-like n=2 Tax=Echinops telfairi TaxID=9371 RepID=A0AC55D4P8_ECHTE|nr:protein tyrosine phosphatase type IVA 1-like [Echinops telfairi]XP_045146722.1 protein tyrosine phosphatase type IVA 1-like [Echinops telfairi]